MIRPRTALLALALVVLPTVAFAQVPPRFYWKTLSGGNGAPLIFQSLSGNANPLDPAYVVTADVEFDAEILLAGYARVFTLFDRSASLAALVPMGRVGVRSTVESRGSAPDASGFGDPMVEFAINVVGPESMRTIPDVLRYEPGFSIDFIADAVVPVGEYESDRQVNLGQNRWYGRVGAPTVWQLGAWVPGRRTTLELLPSLWLYGDNDDFRGRTLATDPMFQLQANLTRDFTDHFWGSFDLSWMTGGESTIAGRTGEALDNLAVGFTVGTPLTESLQLTLGYAATVNDSDPTDLRMDGFRVSVVYGWHRLLEGIKRLGEDE